MSFSGKVVLVSGSSSGIGAATAISFARKGAHVAIVGRNEAKLLNVAEKCSEVGEYPLILVADISKDKDAKSIIEKTISKFGKLDVLINNAGITRQDSILSEDLLKMYDEVMTVNLRAVVLITNLASPHLIKTKGNIVNVSSSVGSKACGMICYCVSKAGMNHFTRCIALQLARFGVRANTVSPGPVETDIIVNCGLKETWDNLGAIMPLKKVSQPEEVADLITYLASDKAKSVTGANVSIDNGSVLK